MRCSHNAKIRLANAGVLTMSTCGQYLRCINNYDGGVLQDCLSRFPKIDRPGVTIYNASKKNVYGKFRILSLERKHLET